jgi:hypothetical protein
LPNIARAVIGGDHVSLLPAHDKKILARQRLAASRQALAVTITIPPAWRRFFLESFFQCLIST